MALTPLSIGPKKEQKSGWDTVAQAMQIAGTAANVAGTVNNLVTPATPPPAPAAPVTAQSVSSYKLPDMTPKIAQAPMDAFQRRLQGGR